MRHQPHNSRPGDTVSATRRFLLRGDFDIRVEFRLLQWPEHNGVRTAIGLTDDLYDDYGVERTSLSASEPLGAHEVYIADFGPFVLVDTQDIVGAMRLVRTGNTQTGSYAKGGEWIPIQTDIAPTGDLAIQLHAWSHDYAFQHHEVRAAFDNFTVVSGQLIWNGCPAADLNGDGRVDLADFQIFLDYYIAEDARADFTSDGLVDFSDYLEFLNLFEGEC